MGDPKRGWSKTTKATHLNLPMVSPHDPTKVPPTVAEDQGTRLVVVNDTLLETHLLPEEGNVTIGRAPEAEIRVPHRSVSRRHAILHLGPDLTLEDLHSSNGTTVNNVRLTPMKPLAVRPGDSIRVGDVAIVLQRDWETLQPGTDPITHNTRLARASKPEQESALRTATDLTIDGNSVVTRSEAMRAVLTAVGKVARSDLNVLILGETGVGKEIAAHAIHAQSARSQGPFLGINCAALSETLLESEIFGHEKGAFTGAHQTKIGLLEQARGGTVFLDEVGDMTLPIQAKLLRVFEERQVLRLGSLVPRSIDVRIVAATNHDLESDVAAGRFRRDFYFRLNGFAIPIPPLRERKDDIAPLAQLFIQMASTRFGLPSAPELSDEALEALLHHDWPGNVRELRNLIERAVVLSNGDTIAREHVGVRAKGRTAAANDAGASQGTGDAAAAPAVLEAQLVALERARIVDALSACHGNQTRAAELLGMPRRSFLRKLDAHGIERPRKTSGRFEPGAASKGS